MGIGCNGVVPLAMEFAVLDVKGRHLGVGDDNAFGVLASVELAAHGEAGFGGGGRDQLDNHAITDEGLGTPVLADEGEQPVLDFVPLAGAGRQVADRDVETELVCQLLQFAFPQADPRAVAAAAVGGDQQSSGVGVARPPDLAPPLADAVDREGGGVVVDADAHPPSIRGQIIDPIGHRATEFFDQKVVDPNLLRIALGAIFAAVVAKVPDQFLFLGVDRDHRLLFAQSRRHLRVDMGELGIAVGMSNSATRLWLTWWPCSRSAAARCRMLLQVHRNGDWGSPRLVGSTSASRSGRNVGSLRIAGLRPAPGRRIRGEGSSSPNSVKPRPIVLGAMPVALATAVMPPYPAANASAAATRRRPRSSRNGATMENRSRMGSISITTTRYGMQTWL